MDSHLLNVFVTLGWALLAGLLILMVPLLYRKAKYADRPRSRVVNVILMLVFLSAFCGLAWWLWTTRAEPNLQPRAPVVEEPPVAVVEPS